MKNEYPPRIVHRRKCCCGEQRDHHAERQQCAEQSLVHNTDSSSFCVFLLYAAGRLARAVVQKFWQRNLAMRYMVSLYPSRGQKGMYRINKKLQKSLAHTASRRLQCIFLPKNAKAGAFLRKMWYVIKVFIKTAPCGAQGGKCI